MGTPNASSFSSPKTPDRYAKRWGDTLEGPKTTSLLPHRVNKKCCHEQTNGNANGNLDHGCCNVKDDRVQTIGGGLLVISWCHLDDNVVHLHRHLLSL